MKLRRQPWNALPRVRTSFFQPHEIHIGLPRSVATALAAALLQPSFLPLLVLFYHILDCPQYLATLHPPFLLLQVNDQPVKALVARGHACEQKEYRHPREECPPRRVAAPHDGFHTVSGKTCECMHACVGPTH